MKKDEYDFVDVRALRIGLFVDLELGWMDHPFPIGKFKISSQKQIDTLQSLGLERVRFVPAKSSPVQIPHSEVDEGVHMVKGQAPSAESLQAVPEELKAPLSRAQLLEEQNRKLVVCERRFGESVRQYRKVLEHVAEQPKEMGQQTQGMVQSFVKEFMEDSVSSIRLLTEGAGDRASMHPVNVTVLSLLLGHALELPKVDLVELGVAAFLHDIGKARLPARVRWPDEGFSSTENRLYQEHVAFSLVLGKTMDLSNAAQLAIGQHHELADGTGFPVGLYGDNIAMTARILALVNRYDNLCNSIHPGATLTPHEALALMFAQQKTRFDQMVLSGFIRMMGVYPPGSVVQLIDDRYAMVVSVNSARPLKPRVIVHEPSVAAHEALILDLEKAPTLGIRRSLKPSSLPTGALHYLAPRQNICYFFEPVSDPDSQQRTQ
jgi:HD-GYP domain-containing protein (c-di-GMP phosphodiesterase class II)